MRMSDGGKGRALVALNNEAMKIIKHGKEPNPNPDWWIGLRGTCHWCDALVAMDSCANEIPARYSHSSHGVIPKRWIEFKCPTNGCGGCIVVEEDRQPKSWWKIF